MMTTEKAKTSLVTGGGSGIGRATVILLAENNVRTIICGRDEAKLIETKKLAGQFSENIIPFKVDLSDSKQVDQLFAFVKTIFGELTYAVNNAGTEGNIGSIQTQTLEDFDQVMNLNLRSLWYCLKNEVQLKTSSIVNVASVSGLHGTAQLGIYCASKHGVVGLTKAIAKEVATMGIRINCVCPGSVDTEMLERATQKSKIDFSKNQPMGRIAKPLEIANSIYWLLSDESSYVTGQSLVIDGGALL
jgi:NAD(P)-dependent dehydrogenase (short-subunit alcohol dehydrogenase family)